ncbi:MAG: hypothetical protein K940chlam1_00728 [Candidatus Anoxychlamydiales bacterium]|nr:hypothetical protein [Candidatus Anoxychlamydiales bacterium]NGX36520.1 hypothetical protein [Candidatus Anoxychlamydiales bacterium]
MASLSIVPFGTQITAQTFVIDDVADPKTSQAAKKSEEIFANRPIQDFDNDVAKLNKIIFGSKLGWSKNFKPEVYKEHIGQEAVRWAYSWSNKKVDGLESSQISIKWVEAYLKSTAPIRDVTTVKADYTSLVSSFYVLAQTAELLSNSDNKGVIGQNYRAAAQKIEDLTAPKKEVAEDLIKFD